MEPKTIVIVICSIIGITVAIYFIFFSKSKRNNGGGGNADVCKCPQGCDSDGNCLQTPCSNGHVHNDAGECVCPPGMIGPNCGCDTNNYPPGVNDPCHGFGFTCITTGDTDKWVESTAQTCDDLYKMNCDPKTGNCSEDSYRTNCFTDICNKKDYPECDTNFCDLECASNSGVARSYCKVGCTKEPGPNDCSTCPPPNVQDKIFNNNAGVCACDPETNKWGCDSSQLKNACETKVPVGLCGDSNEAPQCITCGASSSAWHCSGAQLHEDCTIKRYDLENIKTDDYNFYQTPKTDSEPPMPVFPTFDNNRCLAGIQPYTTLTSPEGSGYESLDSEQGFVDYNSDGSVKVFLPYAKSSDYYIYNLNPTSKNPDGTAIIDFKKPLPTVFPIAPGDDLVFSNGMGCVTPSTTFCNGNGLLNQECWAKDGNKVGCFHNSEAWYKSNTGTCKCFTNFAGPQCQFSDHKDCKDRGTVSDDGSCDCTSTYDSKTDGTTKKYVGPHCEYDDNTSCGGVGIVDNSGNCNCTKTYLSKAQGTNVPYVGPHCEYDDNVLCQGKGIAQADGTCQYICNKVFPRCDTCGGDNKNINQMTCTKTIFSDENLFGPPSSCVPESGCPIIPDEGAWAKYTGTSYHHTGGDDSRCSYPGAKACRTKNSDHGLNNYCWSPDFRLLDPKFKNIDITGLNTEVSGIASGSGQIFPGNSRSQCNPNMIPGNPGLTCVFPYNGEIDYWGGSDCACPMSGC